MTKIRILLATVAAAAFGGAAAAGGLLYDNGDHDPDQSGGTSFGWNQSSPYRFSMADNFTVPAGPGWKLEGLRTFGYTTGNDPITDLILDMYVQIRADAGGSPGAVVFGDMVTALPFTQAHNGTFRGGSAIRPIFEINVDLPNWALAPGDYWVEFNGDQDDTRPDGGGLANLFHPFHSSGSGNNHQFNHTTGAWSARTEELDFKLYGGEVPAPGALALLGLAGLAARRRRRA